MLLVLGSGSQRYREYLLASAGGDRPVWLLDGTAPTWQSRYVRGVSVVDLIDRERLIPDRDGLVKAAGELAARHRIDGVFTYDETLVVTTAHVADALGLPGLGVVGVENCRDKHRTRRVLTDAGLPQPRFAFVTDVAGARAAARRIGCPVVLKPRGMGASIGVVRALDPADVDGAFAVAEAGGHGGAPAYAGGALVEEMVVGPEISVDGAVRGGGYEPFCVARKRVGMAPFFEELGHVVDADDPLFDDAELRDVLVRAHRAVGVRDGVTHTEVKLTDRGPVIIEINARLGGDLIPYLGTLASGVDPALVAADLAAGVRPRLTRRASGVAGIRFCYPPVDGTVDAVRVPSTGDVPGLAAACALVAPGAALRLPPRGFLSRYAYVICRAGSGAECEAALDAAAKLPTVVLRPLDGPNHPGR